MTDERRAVDPQIVDNVLRDTQAPDPVRRVLVKRAALGAAGMGAAALLAACGGSSKAKSSSSGGGSTGTTSATSTTSSGASDVKTLIDTAITAEALAVTYLSGVIENAKGTKVEPFAKVLKAANAEEYRHYQVLKSLGATPLTTKFWAPDAFFGPGLSGVFPTLEVAETLFVNAYLIGIDTFVSAGKPDYARYAGEILGTEAEHLALARYAQGKLPNNLGFMDYSVTSIDGIVSALEGAGVGFGKQGSKPGKFYEFKAPPSSTVTSISGKQPS
ncbi:MAG TPA: hypothetical protein VFT42_11740 [Solirubrobacteraceae bacterium]|nr:hypothetical protein [Solirubrobacteraceae bacterium]